MSDLKYWLWLSQLRELRADAVRESLRVFGSVKALYLAREAERRSVGNLSQRFICEPQCIVAKPEGFVNLFPSVSLNCA